MYKSGSPYLVCEELTDVARRRMPEAVARGLLLYFDYEGALPVAVGSATVLHSLANRLLAHAIRNTAVGSVFFLVRVESVAVDRCDVVLRVADTSAGLPAHETAALGEALAGRRTALGGLAHRMADVLLAGALARSREGSLQIESVEGQGFVAEARLPVRCMAPVLHEDMVQAGGAAAWFIGSPPLSYELLVRRFQRHGWVVHLFDTVEAALRRLDEGGERAPPAMVVATEHRGVTLPAFELLRQRLPQPTVLLMQMLMGAAPLHAGRAAPGIVLLPQPLSPRQLLHFSEVGRLSALRPSGDTVPAALGMAARPRVLVVDDDEVNRVIAIQTLRLLGYEAEAVAGGEAAIAACRQEAPVAVLMDVEMPGLGGLDATRELRRLQRVGELPAFPIIAATGLSSQSTREYCAAGGMDGFLRKPYHASTLHAELRRCGVAGA